MGVAGCQGAESCGLRKLLSPLRSQGLGQRVEGSWPERKSSRTEGELVKTQEWGCVGKNT